MRKALSLILVLVLLLCFCACGNKNDQPTDPSTTPTQSDNSAETPTQDVTEGTEATNPDETTAPTEATPTQPAPTQPTQPAPTQPACSHSFKDATCTAPKTCTKCGATEGETLGHDFWGDTCADCGAPNPNVPLEGQGWAFEAPYNGNVAKVGLDCDKGFGSMFVEYYDQSGAPVGFGGSAELNYVENRDVISMTVSSYENDTQGTITLKRTNTDELTITEITGTIIDAGFSPLIKVGCKFTAFNGFIDEM